MAGYMGVLEFLLVALYIPLQENNFLGGVLQTNFLCFAEKHFFLYFV